MSTEGQPEPEWPAFCTVCGRSLADVGPNAPCPGCGATTRRYQVTDSDAGHAEEDASVGISSSDTAQAEDAAAGIGFGARTWPEQWQRVQDGLAALEDAAAGRGVQPADPQQIPTDFCVDCLHLKDWLRNDQTVPPTARQQSDTYAASRADIQLACDVANTHKHLSRFAKQTTARVAGVSLAASGARRFVIEWTEPGGASGTRDALDLARQAVADWQAFLTQHGLN